MPALRSAAARAFRLNCGLCRLSGADRTSAMAVMPCCLSRPMNLSIGWLE